MARFLFRRISLGMNRRLRGWSLRGGYRPERLWEIWGRSFVHEEYQRGIYGQHRWLLDRIGHLRPRTVLEVGCGYGRNLRLIAENGGLAIERLLGVDLSASMLRSAVRKYGLSPKCLVRAEASQLPFSRGSFDVVFTMGLLMHVPGDAVGQTLSELARVAGGNLLFIEEWDESRRGEVNEYTYVHDYPDYLTRLGVRIVDRLVVTNRETLICIHGEVKP